MGERSIELKYRDRGDVAVAAAAAEAETALVLIAGGATLKGWAVAESGEVAVASLARRSNLG